MSLQDMEKSRVAPRTKKQRRLDWIKLLGKEEKIRQSELEIKKEIAYLCSVCNDAKTGSLVYSLGCGHHFHRFCLEDKKKCPTCDKEFTLSNTDGIIRDKIEKVEEVKELKVDEKKEVKCNINCPCYMKQGKFFNRKLTQIQNSYYRLYHGEFPICITR